MFCAPRISRGNVFHNTAPGYLKEFLNCSTWCVGTRILPILDARVLAEWASLMTGLVDYPSRKAIYTSFIASNFNYCPLVWFFTSRDSINKIDKIQERALRFVLKDHISCYKDLLMKSGFDSFRIYAVKSLMIELYTIWESMTPNYLSELFVKADTPYNTRDKCRLIQPMKRTTTYGLRSFQYYGAHAWNMLHVHMKAAQSLSEFKSFIKSWPGPTCSCPICIALL